MPNICISQPLPGCLGLHGRAKERAVMGGLGPSILKYKRATSTRYYAWQVFVFQKNAMPLREKKQVTVRAV